VGLSQTISLLEEYKDAAAASLLRALFAAVSKCRRCGLAETRFDAPVLGSFWPGADFLIVGEGPGAYEERTLKPFVGVQELLRSRCIRSCPDPAGCLPLFGRTDLRGRCTLRSQRDLPEAKVRERVAYIASRPGPLVLHTAGEVLNRALAAAGFTRVGWGEPGVPVSLTNVVRCRSARNGKDAPPTAAARSECFAWTAALLEVLQPKTIIACGASAARVLLCDDELLVSDVSFKLHNTAFGPVYAIPHPASALYTGRVQSYIERVAGALRELANRVEVK